MSTAILYRMDAGIPGAVSRAEHATISPEVLDTTYYPTAYGVFVKIVSGAVRKIASGDAASDVRGVLVRPFPTSGNGTDGLGTSTPPTSGICDVLRRGYIFVKLAQGTAAKEAAVYVRVTADTGKLVGDIETAADSGKCVAVTGAYFTGAADANGNVEIAFNI
jgi:hypothetical protein